MNASNIPTSAPEWLHFFVAVFTDALHTAVTSHYWLAALLTLLVVMAATYCAPAGNDEKGPLLTEAEREAAR
jgi:hypothetical protein